MNIAFLFALLGILMLALALAALAALAVSHFRLTTRVALLEHAPKPAPPSLPAAAAAPLQAPSAPAPVAPPPPPIPAAPIAEKPMVVGFPGSISHEDFAIIAAAINSLLGRSASIVQIAPAEVGGGHAWSMEGRRSIYQSHNIRR